MKKLFLFLSIFFLSATVMAQKGISITREDGNYKWKLVSRDKKENLTINGKVTLSDDDKDVKSVSQNGFIDYKRGGRQLRISNSNGNLVYTINGMNEQALSATDRALVDECVQFMIKVGVNAEARVARIFSQKGVEGVLNEVARFENDYVKEIYLSALLTEKSLTDKEMVSLLDRADRSLTSHYYKSELLEKIMPAYLSNGFTSDAYLNVVAHISSDYYQYTAIKKLLKSDLSGNQYNKVLDITGAMKSDYYQSEVLKYLLTKGNLSENRFVSIMKMASGMKSDYYKSEIISALLKSDISDQRYSQTIAAMENMKSPYYQSQILSKLIDSNIKEGSEWSKLIAYSGKINSDYYQSEVLAKIAVNMPASDLLDKQMEEAAKSIRSDYYYGKVARAMDRRK